MTESEVKSELLNELESYAKELWTISMQKRSPKLSRISEGIGDCIMTIRLAWSTEDVS